MTGCARASAGAEQIWTDLATTMRLLRTDAGMSLRRAELESGVGRGTLSQVETGKARPNRTVVEWYDTRLQGDGLLVAMFAEARGAHGVQRVERAARRHDEPGDAAEVADPSLPHGALVEAGARLVATWTLRNRGSVPWRNRRLARMGPHTAARLITSELWTPLPDCPPGESVGIDIALSLPAAGGTYAAYWDMIDEQGRSTLALATLLGVVVTAVRPD